MSRSNNFLYVFLFGVFCVLADDSINFESVKISNTALPSSCAEAHFLAGGAAKNGIYRIQISDSDLKPFYVYCLKDPDGGPAWTVVQRRQNGNINFLRNWAEYKIGFGNLNTEFNIGMDKLHAMTNAQLNELWIQMEDFEGGTRYAKYANFAIGNEREKYALNVLGAYSGDAGDSLTVTHEGQGFSTIDQNNSGLDNNNCAEQYKGAWWYKSCHESNLNGLYQNGVTETYAQGINWKSWRGYYYSLKYVHMAIRPVS